MSEATRVPTPSRASKLTLTFGLVNVPVSMKPFGETKRPVSGKMTCPEHGPVLKQQYVCSQGTKDEHVIPNDEIVKSYEHPDRPGEMVVLEQAVLDEFTESRTGFATIERVVDTDSIDPCFYEQTHLVWPGDGGELGFDLFTSVLREQGKAAVTTCVISKRTRMVVFRWSEQFGCLLGHVVRFAGELRMNDLALVKAGQAARPPLDAEQAKMAAQLLSTLEGDFNPEEVTDTYTDLMRHAIRSRADGTTFAKPKAEPQPSATDLMDALTASIQAVSGAKPKAPTKPRARKPKARAS
jgi:DNA end-binding protein Ku